MGGRNRRVRVGEECRGTTQVEWRQLKTAAEIKKSRVKTMVEKTSKLELVATLRSRKIGGWCHRGGVAQGGRRKSGGWCSQGFGGEGRRRVHDRLGVGEGEARGIAGNGLELGGGETHQEGMASVVRRCTAQVQVASAGCRGTGQVQQGQPGRVWGARGSTEVEG